MTSRRKLRCNLLRFKRYRARYVRPGTWPLTNLAACGAHYRALVRLEQHPAEAFARWRKDNTCQPGQPFACGDYHHAGHCIRPLDTHGGQQT